MSELGSNGSEANEAGSWLAKLPPSERTAVEDSASQLFEAGMRHSFWLAIAHQKDRSEAISTLTTNMVMGIVPVDEEPDAFEKPQSHINLFAPPIRVADTRMDREDSTTKTDLALSDGVDLGFDAPVGNSSTINIDRLPARDPLGYGSKMLRPSSSDGTIEIVEIDAAATGIPDISEGSTVFLVTGTFDKSDGLPDGY